MTHKRQRRRRNRLFKEDPKCYHCGCDLIMPEHINQSSNSATLDHIYSRPDPREQRSSLGTPCCPEVGLPFSPKVKW